MNTINFNQSIGFPLETEILDFMQKSYSLFNAFGAVAGDFSIIKGCEVSGGAVNDGVVYINGELLPFKGAPIDANVVIIEEKQALEFEDTISRDVTFTRYATFGGGSVQWAWSTFKRGMPTIDIASALAGKASETALSNLANTVTTMLNKLNTIDEHAKVQVNTDWNATSGKAQLLNKPDYSSPYLYKGYAVIGDIVTTDMLRTINFPNVGTNNYMVLGSLRCNTSDWNKDNDVFWTWRNQGNTSFDLILREITGNVQDLTFYYILIPL